jgi:two-component system OmpR family sensor kinase
MSLSIRGRLTIGTAVALLITLAGLLIAQRLVLGGVLEGDLDSDLEEDASLVSARIALLPDLEDRERLQAVVNVFSAGQPGSAFVVVIRDREGKVLAATEGVVAEEFAVSESEVEGVLAGSASSRTLELEDGSEVRLRTSRLTVGRDVVGIVQVAQDAALTSRVLDRLTVVLVVVGVVGGAVALAVGYWLARGAVRPLRNAIGVAAEIEASDLSRRIGLSGAPTEVQALADTFDAMLVRLDTAFQQQRNFVLDMSHELRTPLATLRGNIDVLMLRTDLDADTRAWLERMSAEVSRLIRLTSNLLYMAHAEAGRALDRRPVELDVLCLEVYRQTKGLRPDVKYRLGREEQVTVAGDRDLLKQVLLNLVDNSLKYTPADGEVTLSISTDDSRAVVEVTDTGPGIDPEELPHIFKRFYRGERSRSGGAGIGLAIADWIVKAHGGEVQVASEVGKGSVFTVLLPLSGDEEGSAGRGAAAPEEPEGD